MTKSPHDLSERSPVRVNPVTLHPEEKRTSLDGEWGFRLDPKDEGVGEEWFAKPRLFGERITVPGCWQGQGFGHDGEEEVWDFRLRERVFRATYEGTAWYGKRFLPPKEWRGRRIWLNFGGAHPSAEVWLNSRRLGSHCAPFVPFGFDISDLADFDRDNFLAVRVHEENRWLGLAYNWQGKWSGLYRSVELTATGNAWVERLWVHGDVDRRALLFRVKTAAEKGAPSPVTLKVSASPPGGGEVAERVIKLEPGSERRFALPIESPLLWGPDDPNLYQVDALLLNGTEVLDAASERVGLVQLGIKGKHFLINGEPYYMRGSGDFAISPETGCPDTDRQRWLAKLGTLRQYGYNYVRCQSYVPTPEYYDAADEVGLLVQGEMGMLGAWGGNSQWHVYAWPPPAPKYRHALKRQWDQTVMRDMNHPSAAIYCMSNELGTETQYPFIAWQCYRDTKATKPSAFVIWTDGGHSPALPGDFINAEADVDGQYSKPVVQHEFRWWSSYPDVRAKGKFQGAIRPYHIERTERAADRNGMTHLLPLMAEKSQRLQYVEARGKLDRVRRGNARLAGICHFTAMDIGLSPQGVVDEFYETKYVGPDTWQRTWGDTVVLVDRDFDDRVLAGGELLRCNVFVSDFSHPPLAHPALEWEFWAGERRVGEGRLEFRHRPFRTRRAGRVEVEMPEVSKPLKAMLRATLREGTRTHGNEWDFWLFPRQVEFPESVAVHRGQRLAAWVRQLRSIRRVKTGEILDKEGPGAVVAGTVDETLVEYMQGGGRILLVAGEGLVRAFYPKLGLTTGRYFFLPPANYPPLEDGNSGTIIAHHPMLGDLPHEGFADLQFYRLIAGSPPLDLLPFGNLASEPVIRALSTYFVCHPLAYLAEFAVGKGGVIISALDLNQEWPEARYLLASILRYASGRAFQPKDALSTSGLEHLLDAGRL